MTDRYVPRDTREAVEEELLRDLVERYPDVMPIFDRMDVDLEGLENRTLAEAARIRGFEPGPVIDEITRSVKTGKRVPE